MKKITQIAFVGLVILYSAGISGQDYVNAFKIGSSDHDEAYGLFQDSQGNYYVSGNFQETVDFDPGSGEAMLTAINNYDGFLAKYDEDWNYLWAIQIGGSEYVFGRQVVVDESGNVYMTGYFNGEADFDPGSGTYMLNGAEMDGFVAKYDQNGNFVWAFDLGTEYNCTAYDMALDHAGNVWVSGVFKGDLDFDPSGNDFILSGHGFQDIFLAKYSYDGDFIWAGEIGGETTTFYSPILACDDSGNLYCSSQFANACDLDPGSGTLMVESAGSSEILLLKLDQAGTFQWGFAMGGILQDVPRDLIFSDGRIVVTGFFEDVIDFDPSSGNATFISTDDYDAYIAVYNTAGEYLWANNIAGLTFNCPAESNAVAEDNDHNLYITGSFYGTVDFDPTAASHEITAQGMWDIFTAKYDSNGNFQWANYAGGNDNDYGHNILVEKENEAVVVIGKFMGYAEFDNLGAGYILSANGGFDGFVAAYTATAGASIDEGAGGLENMIIYPNPAADVIFIVPDEYTRDCRFGLINILGAQVLSGKLHSGANKVFLGDITPGIYFLSLENHEGSVVRKIMVRD